MGCFDTLRVPCRHCGEPMEFQSKAGECAMYEYSLRDVPASVAADLDGDADTCGNCGGVTRIRTQVFVVTE